MKILSCYRCRISTTCRNIFIYIRPALCSCNIVIIFRFCGMFIEIPSDAAISFRLYICRSTMIAKCVKKVIYRNYVPATSQHIYPEPDNSGGSSWYIGNTFFLYSPNIANITYAHKLFTYIGSFYPYIITSKKRFVLFCHSGLFFAPIGKTPTEKALTRCVGLKVPNRLTVISAPSEKISFNLISYDGNRYL